MKCVKKSSVIPFFGGGEELNVMLITSRNDGLWIIPIGHLEPNMTPAESAEKEAYEEAGVTGILYKDNVFTYHFERHDTEYGIRSTNRSERLNHHRHIGLVIISCIVSRIEIACTVSGSRPFILDVA